MRDIQRKIQDVKRLRGDLSNFLVHLTKPNDFTVHGKAVHFPAKNCLESILDGDKILPAKQVGQFAHKFYKQVKPEDLKAVCFTEAPIDQIYLFIGIEGRAHNFSSYGLVFDSDILKKSPYYAAPVMYFSQPEEKDFHFNNFFNRLEQKHYADFKDILYLFDRFGKYVGGDKDFRWEREWRIKGMVPNVKSVVKFGLCPEQDISYFENKYAPIKFIDPFFHPQQALEKLQRANII